MSNGCGAGFLNWPRVDVQNRDSVPLQILDKEIAARGSGDFSDERHFWEHGAEHGQRVPRRFEMMDGMAFTFKPRSYGVHFFWLRCQ
ncbi:hypothetical protein BES08_25720 (plasmid) [Novosphingobium resinovorum]|jgi:hypothetical protein|uniref:Uncharacterized protein n=1 Tax=Novosphingobium resinovorum TaxID=158500 RepID=A0A1D8ADV0_9SPHN|nr:hypothetical protein BES08_25720 [Novosphingobium resinovorum]